MGVGTNPTISRRFCVNSSKYSFVSSRDRISSSKSLTWSLRVRPRWRSAASAMPDWKRSSSCRISASRRSAARRSVIPVERRMGGSPRRRLNFAHQTFCFLRLPVFLSR